MGTETATEPTVAATLQPNDAVLSPDGAVHAVAKVTKKGRATTVCGLSLATPKLATEVQPDTVVCDACQGKPAQEPAPEPEAETPAQADNALDAQRPADELPAPAADAPSAEDEQAADAEDEAAEPEQNGFVHRALMPTLAAVAAGKVGYYELEQKGKEPNATFRLRDTRDGKLAPEAFTSRGDAAWFAQRRSRLSQYQGFGGTQKLFMPKVPSRVGPFEIVGDLGKVEVQLDGARLGPVWTHKTNGRVDALRWAERLARKPEYALLVS